MLLHLIRKELLGQVLSLRFAVACIVCPVGILSILIVLTWDYVDSLDTYHMNLTTHHNEVIQRSNPWDLWKGIEVDRPPNPLKIFVRGIHAENTERVRVISRVTRQFHESYEEDPTIPIFPVVDFTFFVGTIMSLLALAFGYDALSGERERGTLKLVLSYRVPRDLILLGKWIGGYVALITPFLISFLAGLTVLVFLSKVDLGGENALSVGFLLIAALLYLSAMYSLGLFISARTQHSSTSIIISLLVWVVLILGIPNLAPYIAGQFAWVPSRESVDRQIEEMIREQWRKEQGIMEKQQNVTGGSLTSGETPQKKIKALKEQGRRERKKLEDSYARAVEEQTKLAGHISRLSPLASFTYCALEISATGIKAERSFENALESYGQMWYEYARKKTEEIDQYAQTHPVVDVTLFRLNASDYPRFRFDGISLADRLQGSLIDALLLVIWNLIFFMSAYFSFLKYDPT